MNEHDTIAFDKATSPALRSAIEEAVSNGLCLIDGIVTDIWGHERYWFLDATEQRPTAGYLAPQNKTFSTEGLSEITRLQMTKTMRFCPLHEIPVQYDLGERRAFCSGGDGNCQAWRVGAEVEA